MQGTGAPHSYSVQAGPQGMAVGRADHVSYYAASRAPASWPLLVGVVPGPARCFRRRPDLDEHFLPTGEAGPAGAQPLRGGLLTGTAGTGKTQQAAHLARTAWSEGLVDLVVWVDAADRESVVAGYAQALAEITGSAAPTSTASPEAAARSFLAWLESGSLEPRRRWLIVLDDVADPDDVRGLWPPDQPHGLTLVTTRRRNIARPGAGRHVVPVEGFTPAEATAYLREVLGGLGDRPEEAWRLAEELGRLPLALSQAAGHLLGRGLDCAGYRRLLNQDGGSPLSELVPGPGALPDGQAFAVHEAWLPSLDRADRMPETAGLARPLMELAALLPPEGAPEAVFTGSAAREHLRRQRTQPSADGAGPRPDEVVTALRELDRLGLVGHAPQDPYRAVRVHPVLQRVTRDAVPGHRAGRLAWTVASALVDAADRGPDDPGLAEVLAACAGRLGRLAGSALWTDARRDASTASLDALFGGEPPLGAHPLFFRIGELLGEAGLPEDALDHFERLADEALRRQGPRSSVLHGARERLAHWRGESGDPAGAAAAYADVLAEQIRSFGPGHART
ncbi:tetratricopeptide repeat protein, partial [Streptomyces sp. NPDC054956]